ncbi:cytokine receptor-like [Rhagoletis pomonella]|uniref:cytokine receptor-like n=1 Tax=Rhagoletis pomonella TaxID=28610 RepID=UPI00177E73DF|nr:cytokine receptor-like [Rhagoletis pomonella]
MKYLYNICNMMIALFRCISTAAVGLLWLALCAAAYRDEFVGETIPANVEMNVGDSVNISCLINPTIFSGENPCEMYFINELTRKRVPDEDILIMNSTYIVYMLRNAPEQSSRLLCKCDRDAIMETYVYVGTSPRGVSQFNCRSYDFEYMVCNFTQPENPVLTQYNLTYYIHSPDYETPAYCNFDMKPLVVCNITAEHSYRPQIEEYHFKVHSSNALGSIKQEFTINNLNVMVPAKPGQDFRILKLTTDSMEATWSMPKYDSYTPNKHRGLQWEVLLQPDGFPARNTSAQVRVVRVERGCKLFVSELPYAYYWYELRLRVKVRNAAASEDMWSPTFRYRFRTQPRLPDRPPRTDNGGFYVNPLETEVRLYWEQLEKWEENGDNFTYVIRAEAKPANGRARAILPRQQEASFAVFEWRYDLHYIFDISSRNHLGESSASSRITIYPQTSRSARQHTPKSIHNVYHQTNRSYTLTWLPPVVREDLQSYTVYWCYSKLAMPTDCRGSIHFRQVSRDTHRFATEPQVAEHDHSLTLAVSANYHQYNTGMHWTSCSVDVNADFEPMEPEVQSISATELRVQWSSKTVCPSILSGYNLTYCEVANSPDTDSITPPSVESGLFESYTSGRTVSADKAPCRGPATTITIDKNWNKCNITGLKPYTLYRLEMFMFSNLKVGKPNEPLVVRTFESAPTPPRQLHVSNLTDTSARISWLPPSQTNGYIRQYIVKLNNREFVVNASADNVSEISYVLTNLTSYTAYKAFVIAVTRYNSDHSNDIHFTTYMSAPSQLGSSKFFDRNNGEVELSWTPPKSAGGRLDFYEVAVTQLRGNHVERRRISVVFGTRCILRAPTCPDLDYQTKVDVRAINAGVIANNEVNPSDIEAFGTPAQNDAELSDYDGTDDLVCTGPGDRASIERQKAQLKRYLNNDEYLLYKSEWFPGTSFGCSPRSLGRITAMTLMIVCTSILLMALMFFATKKWKMMSDIHCSLPPALDAYLTKELHGNANGCGGATTNGDVRGIFVNDFFMSTTVRNGSLPPLHGSHERLHNEEHHLLGALKHDSGFIGDGLLFGRSVSAVATSVAADNEGSEESLAYRGREYLNSESSADSLIGSTNSSGGGFGEGDAQDVGANAVPLKRIAEEPSGYVQPPQVQAAAKGGYVTPTDLNAWTQPKATAKATAVPIDRIGAASGNDGYIQAEVLAAGGKQTNLETPSKVLATGATAAFGGYVTPNELTTWSQQNRPVAADAVEANALHPTCFSGYIKPTDLSTPDAWPEQAMETGENAQDSGIKSDYIKVNDLRDTSATVWPQQQQEQQQVVAAPALNSGYVTVDSLTALASKATTAATPVMTSVNSINKMQATPPSTAALSPSTSGYVHPNTLQKMLFSAPTPPTAGGKAINSPFGDTNLSGYTTLDALGKLTPPQGARTMNLPADQTAGGKPGLIGYVTQREMNEFGQQQQQQIQ